MVAPMSEIEPQADGPRPATRPTAAPMETVVHLLRGERGADPLSSPVWPEIDGGILNEKTPALPAFPLDLLPLPWRGWETASEKILRRHCEHSRARAGMPRFYRAIASRLGQAYRVACRWNCAILRRRGRLPRSSGPVV